MFAYLKPIRLLKKQDRKTMTSLENHNYYSDPRTIAQLAGSSLILGANKAQQQLFVSPIIVKNFEDLPKLAMNEIKETLNYVKFKGQEAVMIQAPIHNALCPMCEGDGTVVNPSIDFNGLSNEDFYDDPEFEEDYHSGRYDIQCPNCKGNKIIQTINYDQVNKKSYLYIILNAIQAAEEERYQRAKERADELKWGY